MVGKVRFNFAKLSGKIAVLLTKITPGSGGNIPGYIISRIGGYDSVQKLAGELKLGSVIVTGTNGKTTTTTLLIKLLSNDIQIRQSFENNTINSISTAIFKQKGDLGVFEYGIRDKAHGIPDTVQKVFNPIGVVYTTISKEHTQVAGVKNPFSEYLDAKAMLTKDMDEGVIVSNADDPRTAFIAFKKEADVKINYYGLDVDGIKDSFEDIGVECPNCGAELTYSKRFLNHRGLYECECGFKRPEPNVKLTNVEFDDRWTLTIEGDLYNYINKKDVSFNVKINVPPFGLHNIYNTLASITAYATFTPKTDEIENTIKKVFNNLDMSFIPPGRFEVVDVSGKKIGIGQGDNGDAAKINALFMKQYVDGPLEFIYTTPDEGEEDIFNDHFEVIKNLNPEHIIVVPGRKSIKKAEEYYNIIKKEYPNSVFYPLSYEKMNERIAKLTELAVNSSYDYIIMTGCGEEQAMWEKIKRNMINR